MFSNHSRLQVLAWASNWSKIQKLAHEQVTAVVSPPSECYWTERVCRALHCLFIFKIHSSSHAVADIINTVYHCNTSRLWFSVSLAVNPLMGILKPKSSGPLYSNTMGGLLVMRGGAYGRDRSPPRPLLAVPNVTAHPPTASVPTSYYFM